MIIMSECQEYYVKSFCSYHPPLLVFIFLHSCEIEWEPKNHFQFTSSVTDFTFPIIIHQNAMICLLGCLL